MFLGFRIQGQGWIVGPAAPMASTIRLRSSGSPVRMLSSRRAATRTRCASACRRENFEAAVVGPLEKMSEVVPVCIQGASAVAGKERSRRNMRFVGEFRLESSPSSQPVPSFDSTAQGYVGCTPRSLKGRHR